MKEKYKTATDESYRDLSNIVGKLQKHQAFEAELKANNDRLKDLNQVKSRILPLSEDTLKLNCSSITHDISFIQNS